MQSGNIGRTVDTKAARVWPCQEKGSGRTTWLNPENGSYWKTSTGTSEKELEEDCGDRYETDWSL